MNLEEARKRIPELAGLSDESALNVIHKVYYPTMDKAQLAERLGYKAPTPPAPERSWGEVAQDVGITALKSAIAVPETVVGMADLVSGGRAGKLAEEAGFRPREAKAMLDEGYSDKQKAAFKAVQDAEGIGGTFMAAVENPSVIGHSVLESAAPVLAGGVVARGLMGIGARGVSAAAGGVGPAIPGVMTRAIGSPQAAGLVAGALGEGVTMAGSAAEQIRQQTADGLLTADQAGLAAATGIAGTAIGVLGGRIAQKFGVGDVDTMLAGAAANPALAKGVVRSTLEAAFSEGVLEELPQSVVEQVLQNQALGRPLDEGVDQAAVLGTLAGGAMGAGANLVSRAGGPAPEPMVKPQPGPMGRAAQKAPAPAQAAAPLPMPTPEHAQALLAHANERARLIEEKAKGTKDQKITGPDGKPMVVPGRRPEFLTPEEKAEREFLNANGGDAAALAQVYPDVVAPPAPPIGQSLTGTSMESLLGGGGLQGGLKGGLDPVAGRINLRREAEAATAGNIQQFAANQPPRAAGDAFNVIEEAKARGLDFTVAPHPDGGFLVVPRDRVSPELAAQAEAELGATIERMRKADAAPVQRAPRTRSDGQELSLNTDPVAGYIEDLRNTNTPAARAYVREFDAGRVTRADVEQRMAIERGKTPDERLAEAAAEGLKLNPKNEPFKTLVAARLAAKTTPGAIIEVPGGYAIRPKPGGNAPAADQAGDWQRFSPETGTLNIPREEMPQVKNAHRGPLVNFLAARGVSHEQVEIDPAELKPSQDGFSASKVGEAADADTDRAILISSDNHIIDGHHQAVAKLKTGQPVRAIRLNAPAADLLPMVLEFPSSTTEKKTNEQDAAAQPAGTQKAGPVPADVAARANGEGSPAVPQAAEELPGALINVQDAPQAATGAPATTGAQATGAQAQADQTAAPARGDGAAAGGVPDAGAGAGVRADGVKTEKDIESVLLKSIADSAIKRNQKYYGEQVSKGRMDRAEADRRADADAKMWGEQKSNDRTQRLAKAIADKDPTVLVGAWAKEGQGTFGNEGSMEAFRTLTGINLKRMNSADRAKAIFDWAGWSEDRVHADVQKRKSEKAEAEAKRDKERSDELADRIEKEAARTPLRIKGQEGESTVKAYIDGLIEQGYTELGQTHIGAIKRALLARPGEGRGYPMQKGVLADYAKVASERFSAAQKLQNPAAPGAGDVQAAGVKAEAFEHAGLKIRPSRVKEGDQVVGRWVVQSPENAEREARGERQIGGDRIVETREQAIKTSEQEVKRYAKEKADRAEIDAREKAERDAAEAKKEANRGKTLLERRADAILDKPGKFPASAGLGLGTKREAMDKAIEQGRLVTEVMVDDTAAKKRDQDAVDAVRRAGYILGASNENIPVVKKGLEAQARLKEGKYQKPEYRVYQGSDRNGSFFEITKTEYDYVQKVKANTPAESKPDQETAAKPAQKAEELPEGWDTLKNGYTGLPVYRFNQGAGQPFAVVTRTEIGYEVQIRHGDKLVTSRNMPGTAKFEALGVATQMLGEASMATHKDPGEKAEPATKTVVNESLKTAAKNEDAKPSEMRKWLLGEIDKALLQAPDRADYDEAVKRMGEKDAVSMFTGNGFLGKNAETGFVTFDVPGDGKFKVRNSTRGLLEFRKNVSASLGFKDSGQKTVKPEQNEGVRSGSGGQMAAITNMIEEGDFEAARDYAEAVGIKLEDVKVPRGERAPEWSEFMKTGKVPEQRRASREWTITNEQNPNGTWSKVGVLKRVADGVEYVATVRGDLDGTNAKYVMVKDGKETGRMTSRQPFSRALEMAEDAMPEANDKPAPSKANDTGWNMAGTGYGGKRYRGRNITTEDGREIVARVYENAGNYDEVEVKVDGVRKFTVRDSYNAQDKADAFVKTLIDGEQKADGTAAQQDAPAGRTYLAVPFNEKDYAKRAGAKWDDDKKLWYADPITGGMAEGEINGNLRQFIPNDYSTDDRFNYYGDKAVAEAVALNAAARDGVEYEVKKRKHPDGMMLWSAVKAGEQSQADAPTIPEGYKPAGEPFYRGGKLTQGYAPFAPGERVTMKDAAGQSGVVESFASPDDAGVFASAVVKFDNGVEQMVPLGKLQAAAAPEQTQATGTRRDPAKVSMFNPYEDGDIVTIDGQDWTVKQDTPGWYLTNTGNWRGTHPTIRNVKAMADLIRAVEQAAVAQPKTASSTGLQAYMAASAEVTRLETALIDLRSDIRVKPKDRAEWLRKIGGLERDIAKAKVERDRLGKELRDGKSAEPEAEPPRLTPAEAAELMEWQSLGTKDGVTKHILTFYRSKEDADAKRGRMTVATVTKGDRSATAWMVDGDDQTFGPLSLAKKRGMEIGMAKAVSDGFVAPDEAKQAPQPEAAAAPKEEGGSDPKRLTDAGEELIRNRRGKLKGLAWDDVSAMNDTMKVSQVVKANVWSRPDYAKLVEDGAPAWKAAALKAIYDKLAAAPVTRAAPTDADLKDYIETMQSIRDLLTAELDRVASMPGDAELWKSLKAENVFGKVFPLPTDARAMFGRPSPFDRSSEQGKANNRRALLIGGNSAVQALQFDYRVLSKIKDLLAAGFPAKQEAWQKSWEVRANETRDSDVPEAERTGQPQQRFYVFEKGSRWRLAKGGQDGGYATKEQAEAFARSLTARKKEALPPSRGLDLAQASRTGPDWRQGKDVTAQEIVDRFGFRGVNLGEYVKAKQDVAQVHLNHVFDAFSDLADLLGVPPRAMSLNGTLGVAIGAQGSGKALAHFVPGVNEINITRDSGAGALAHEFGHALDHYFATQHGRATSMAKRPYLSAVVSGLRENGGVRPEVIEAMKLVMKTINSRPMTEAEARKYMEDQRARNERYLDRWVKEFSANRGADPAALAATAAKLKRGDVGEANGSDVETNIAEFIRAAGLKPGNSTTANAVMIAYRLRDLADEAGFLANHIPQVDTNYSKVSGAMDSKKTGEGYWGTPWEKFARAFETFVMDALKERQRQSLYLSGLVDSSSWREWSESTGKAIPYPEGDERLAMQQAFQTLADTIQTREDDAGNVAMFSRRTASGNRVPDVVIGHKLGDLNRHPDYESAKAGDSLAAARIAIDLVDDAFVQRVRDAAGDAEVIVPVVSVEAAGRNKIPAAVADLLAEKLGSDAETDIVQANAPKRTAMDGLDRLLNPPVFEGPVRKGAAYVLVDDTVTQGGTFASLASHIRDNGGRVSGLVALTGKQYSSKLSPSPELLNQVRERFNDIEPQFRAATGYGFDALTESEARYLVKHDDAQRVRDRIIAAGNQAGNEGDAGVSPRASRSQGATDGLTQKSAQQIVDAIRGRWANAPEVVVVQDMQDPAVPQRVRDADLDQRSMGAAGEPEGFWYGGKAYIVAGALSTPGDVVRVLFHEVLGHYGLRGTFGDGLAPILRQIASLRRNEIVVKAFEYGLVPKNLNPRATMQEVWSAMSDAQRLQAAEEVLAVMAQTKPEMGYVKRAIAAVRAWLRKNVPGFQDMKLTDDEIIQQFILPARRFVEQGPADARARRGGSVSLPALSFSMSKGQNQTETEAFKRWFGDSKVVDSVGKPLVVYHGTNADFDSFKPGAYFSPSPEVASDHADWRVVEDGRGEANVRPVYLSLKNPVVMDDPSALAYEFGEIERLQRQGYDGAISSDGQEYIAFRPEQIKSAIGNNGTFDPANPDIRFSRSADAPNDPRALVQDARQAVNDLFRHPGKLSFWHKSVGTQYDLAQRSPAFKKVYDRVQDFLGDVSYHATQAADQAPSILPKLDTWRDIFRSPLTPEDNKAIAAPIFEGTLAWRRDESGKPVRMSDVEAAAGDLTTEQKAQRLLRGDHVTERTLKMWRGLPVEQYETIIEGKFEREMLAAGIVWTDAELKEIFNLSPKQIELYREFRNATDKSLSSLAISDMLRFGGKDTAELQAQAMDAEDANVAAVMLRDHLLDLAEQDDDRRELLIDTANKMIEKADKVQSLIDRGYAPLSRFGHYSLDVLDADGERVYFGLFESKAEANKMARAMRINFPGAQISQGTMSEEAYKLFAGVSPETLELFGGMLGLESDGSSASDRVFQEYLKLAKGNRSAMKRLIQRKGIAGFSEDAGRVLAGFIYSNARQVASGLHMGAMAEAASAIPNQQGELKDAALKLVDYIKNPVEEAAKFRGLLFAQYLGGSLASAMVNMLQPIQVTIPYLSQFGGARGAALEMKRALGDVLKKTTGDKDLDDALRVAEEEGIVAPQEVHQLMAQAQGQGSLKSGDGTAMGNAKAKASNAVSKVSLAWGKAFGAAEQFNRRLTFIAAYRLAKAKGIDNPAAFAEKTIAETQFVYNKGNKPRWARGAVGGTIFTFKQYSISYLELLSRMATAGEPGSPERAAGRKAALMAVGVLLLMGGAGGLPFMEDVEDLIDGFMQRVLGYNFSTKQKRKELLAEVFGEEGARFVESGLSGLPGAPIDVSGRLGLGNLIPGTGLFVKKDNYSRDIVDAVGPAGDLVRRGFTAAGQLLGGEVGKAVETVSPVAARNLIKAVDMANMGMYRDDRGRKVIDTEGYEALAKAIGFQPNTVARVQEGVSTSQRMISLNKMTESEIASEWAQGIFEQDQGKVAAARAALQEWNRKNPESPIRISMAQILKRVRAMRTSKEDRIAATAPKEIRAAVRRELLAVDQ